MLSRACIIGAYQRKLEEIAALPGVELTVALPEAWQENGRWMRLERAHTQGYRMLVLPVALNGNFHLHFYPTLWRELRRLRPDIVHIDEEPYNLATFLALRAAHSVGARALFFTWQNLARRYPPPFRQMERDVLERSDYGLVGSFEAETVLRGKGYRGPVRLVPQFGVDPDHFYPLAEAQPPAEPFVVGFAGRFVAAKGLNTLIEALSGLQGAWQLRLAGSGPLRRALQEQAAALGVAERIIFESHIASTEMPRYYNRLHAFVLPSLTTSNWKEQFGRVLIEAMACGVPVIGSSSGEIPHVIGEGGLVFPEGDAPALRACLQRLRDDPALRTELGRQGRARVEARYTQARIARDTVEVYQEVLAPSQKQ